MNGKHRRWAAGLVLGAMAILATAGWIQTEAKHPLEEGIEFQYRRVSGSRDSSTLMTHAMPNLMTTLQIDTSDAIDLRSAHYRGPYGIWWPQTPFPAASNGVWSIIDTIWAFSLTASSRDTITSADSNVVQLQGSPDGHNWTAIDTIGVNARILFDLNASANVTVNLFTTQRGIGTDRINWDKPAVNFIRLLHTHEAVATPGRGVSYSITARR